MTNFGYYPQFNQSMYQPQMQQQTVQQAPQPLVDERIWVANEQAAEAYLIAPNSLVRLWDSNKNVFYEKKADATGRLYPMECFKYEKINTNKPIENNSEAIDYRKELDSLNERLLILERSKKNESNTNNKRA